MAESIKISEQWQGAAFKGWRKFIYGRMFTLGIDKQMAIRKAQALSLAAAALKAANKPWTDEAIQKALALATGAFGAETATTAAPSPSGPTATSTRRPVRRSSPPWRRTRAPSAARSCG